MQLEDKVAIVYGAAGPMGGAVARAFAAEGARLFLAGRTGTKVRARADQIESAGGRPQAAEVDLDDRDAVERHAEEVLAAAGRIDISFNAAGMNAVQNMPWWTCPSTTSCSRSPTPPSATSSRPPPPHDGWRRRAPARS